jgi:hypothetical protein
MSDIKIGPGPGNLTPYSDYRQFLCKGAITKGMAVGFDTTTSSASYANEGYSILAASASIVPIGVAMETGATGEWIKVCVEGFCNYVTITATDVTDTHVMKAIAAGENDGSVIGTDMAGTASLIYGIALKTEATTTHTAVWIHRKVAETDIPAGPGNLKGEQEYKLFLVGTAVTRGQVVTHQASSITGYTIQPGSEILVPIGVAAESGAAGEWVRVLVAGYCDYLTKNATAGTSGQLCHSVALGVAAPLAVNTNIKDRKSVG